MCTCVLKRFVTRPKDIDDPKIRARMEALRQAAIRSDDGKAQGGIGGFFKRIGGSLGAGYNFARMYFHRTKPNTLPQSIRLHPAW